MLYETRYRRILEYFFQIYDPTTRNRQGGVIGSSYRSAIYYVDDEQKRIALDTIADVDASGLRPGKVVTEVAPSWSPHRCRGVPTLSSPSASPWGWPSSDRPSHGRRAAHQC
jgi:hypothetical protein